MLPSRLIVLTAVVLAATSCKQCGHDPGGQPDKPLSGPTNDKPAPVPTLYRSLVAGGSWVLHESPEGGEGEQKAAGKPGQLLLETEVLPAVGDAQVVRLRWTLDRPGDAATTFTAENNPANLPLHIAASAGGLFLLDPEGKPADVRRAVQGRPDYPASPRPVAQRTRADGTYVVKAKFKGKTSFCFGEGPAPGPNAPECDDCDGLICFAEGAGVVHLSGNLAPDKAVFSQIGFEG